MRRIRDHLTYANVMATIAVFLVLSGGTAVALSGTDTVQSDDLGPGAQVKAPDVAANAVNGSDVVDNSLAGADVNESSLNLAVGAWREVGATGQPPFHQNSFCSWGNFASNHNSAAFLRDRFGFVHLKGLVDADDGGGTGGCSFGPAGDDLIFNLPAGYRPARREVFATITNGALGRVNVSGPVLNPNQGLGAVSVDAPTTEANAKQWISLDGISFRCAPSGANGCP
jgi:hypothetical protein